ncbi:MAG: hypothetical protein QXT26_06285 [Thermoproteota archaeon]
MGIEIEPPIKISKMRFSLLEDGPIRSFLREWKPILPRPKLFGESIYVTGVGEVDSEIESMIEAKKREWRAKGASENLIRMAEELAREWASKMTAAFAPPELRATVLKYNMAKALEVADRWITRMHAAVVGSTV